MKQAALGIRMHSGWGAVVAVAGDASIFEVLYRARIVVCEAEGPRANQPYHYAAQLELERAQSFLTEYAAGAEHLASAQIGAAIEELRSRRFRVTAAAILLASGRSLPPLLQILAAHPLIHAAEGELFRNVARSACQCFGLRVEGFRERDLEKSAASAWGTAAPRIQKQIAQMGRAMGPPWTQDQKTAALAAAIALSQTSRGRSAHAGK
jgi:hypothetical protein